MKNVLLYVKDIEAKKQILGLCREMGLSVKWLQKGDLGTTVGELAKIEASLRKGGEKALVEMRGENALSEKMLGERTGFDMPDVMVFSGMSGEKLDAFLERYRKAGIAPIGLKAVVTPYNVGWSLGRLIHELTKEQEGMERK